MENPKYSTVEIVEDSLNYGIVTDNEDDEDPILLEIVWIYR